MSPKRKSNRRPTPNGGAPASTAGNDDSLATKKEVTNQMAQQPFVYDVDKSGLPPGFDDQAFKDAVNQIITAMDIPANSGLVLRETIIGMLLLDGNIDPGTPTFGDQIRNRLWKYAQSALVDSDGIQVKDGNGNPLTNKDAFVAVDGVIFKIRTNNNNSPGKAYYQELAAAARNIIDNQRGKIVNDQILLASAVQVALQNYGAGTATAGSFELPPLTGATTGGGTDEIIPDHILGVSFIYAALQLEKLGLFRVVDRNVEIFMNGQLPVSNDMGGNALNVYYWDTVNRMSENARWMQFSRVLGAKGGEISKEVQPNTVFDDLFMRFLSALAEYERQQRVADLLNSSRALSLTGEHVRKAGRDLAANCTLYGYGYTQFAAKKLQVHIQNSLNVLKLPDIQQAWGVLSAWQVVERVSSQEFHTTPNVVKYRTMAESGKRVLDLMAKNSAAWSAISDKPLFQDPKDPEGGSDITTVDQIQFMRHTEYWLAVNGIKDQDVSVSSQPSDTGVSPSIPSLDGRGSNGANADVAGQIQKMLQQGQTPNFDQLKQMVGT